MSPTPPKLAENPLATSNPLLTVAEVASFLRVSPTAVYALCHEGKIIFHGLGCGKKRKCIRIRQSAVEDYLNGVRQVVFVPPEVVTTRKASRGALAIGGASRLKQLGYDPAKG